MIACRFVVTLGRVSITDWSQIYLTGEKDMSMYRAGLFVSIFEVASIFGKLALGRINDAMVRMFVARVESPLAVRLPIAIVLNVLNIVALTLYVGNLDAHSSWAALVAIAILTGVFSSGNIVTLSVMSTEIGEGKHEGFITSICNLASKCKFQ